MTGGTLRRELGLGGAVVTGLGSIIGTGVFVSVAVAAGFAGWWLLLAVPAAALVATFNGLSSAQLAAVHPVSGGTYEYGNRLLGPWWGFGAGWLFLVAKTASAATAALGFAGYLLAEIGVGGDVVVPVAVATVLVVTGLVAGGLRRTTRVNAVLVGTVIVSLGVFVIGGFVGDPVPRALQPPGPPVGLPDVLEATAFLFVAYTGYGRIATLGEEVVEPRRTIPRAVVVTLVVSAVLYLGVAAAGLRLVGPVLFAGGTETGGAPLRSIAPAWGDLVAVGALLALAGVLLNLILGLSRVWLAMGRRGDAPALLGRVAGDGSPRAAVLVAGALVALAALVGDVRTTWSFSAVTVLLYYAITNLAALRLGPGERFLPRAVSWAGLASCAFLAVWVDPAVWGVAAIVVGGGLAGRRVHLAVTGGARSR